jgi:hypothetical protein
VADQATGVFLTFAQPGALMLIPVGITRFVLRKRDGRNPAFLPRGKRPESLHVLNGSSTHSLHRLRKEPTTVDAPTD